MLILLQQTAKQYYADKGFTECDSKDIGIKTNVKVQYPNITGWNAVIVQDLAAPTVRCYSHRKIIQIFCSYR